MRHPRSLCLIISCFACTPVALPGGALAAPITPKAIAYTQSATKNGPKQFYLDFYAPDETCNAPRPTMLMIHGGGFKRGSKAQFISASQALAESGYNVLSINYRLAKDAPILSAPHQKMANDLYDLWPAHGKDRIEHMMAAFEDAAQAVAWMRDNADAYCVDMDHYGVLGSSAGAITAMNLAYMSNNMEIDLPAPKVVVDYAGLMWQTDFIEQGESPVLIVHGNQDKTVPYRFSLSLEKRLKEVGVPYSFYVADGAGHGFKNLIGSYKTEDGKTISDLTRAFIDAHLKDGEKVYERVVMK